MKEVTSKILLPMLARQYDYQFFCSALSKPLLLHAHDNSILYYHAYVLIHVEIQCHVCDCLVFLLHFTLYMYVLQIYLYTYMYNNFVDAVCDMLCLSFSHR
jgi:hypothetical protein